MQVVLPDNHSSRVGAPLLPFRQNPNRKSREQAIVCRILSDDAFVGEAVKALYREQEPEEQQRGKTIFRNHRGYSASDAVVFSPMAERIADGYHLTAEDIGICRRPTPNDTPRLGRYRRQLAELFQDDLAPGAEAGTTGVVQ